jgi:hypothetical protein
MCGCVPIGPRGDEKGNNENDARNADAHAVRPLFHRPLLMLLQVSPVD